MGPSEDARTVVATPAERETGRLGVGLARLAMWLLRLAAALLLALPLLLLAFVFS